MKKLPPLECSRLGELTTEEMKTLRRGICAFHRRRWLTLQRRRGEEEEVKKMEASGVDEKTVRRARYTIRKALWLERMRAGNEEGPINLLWWNWSGPVPRELIEGYKLPLQTRRDNFKNKHIKRKNKKQKRK